MDIQVPGLLRIKPRALNKLGKYIKQEGFTRIALFWGAGIKKLFWERIDISFESAGIRVLYEKDVDTNDIDIAFQTGKELPQEVDVAVAIGGGTVIDFCKYVAFSKQIPLYTVPTLISNDAFASPTSSLTVDSTRRSVKTTVPYAVIVDTEAVKDAPPRYLYSGMGDLFCKTTAVFDWKLMYKKTGAPVNDFAATIATNAVDTFTYFDDKRTENLGYIGIIASSLLMTGMAMIIADSSRPASGSEHLISHAYDHVAKKPSLHGLQVGVASYAVSFLQDSTHERVKRDITESGFFDFVKTCPLDRADFLKAVMMAPDMKENFYTILSERGNIARLEEFVNTDAMMLEMVK